MDSRLRIRSRAGKVSVRITVAPETSRPVRSVTAHVTDEESLAESLGEDATELLEAVDDG
ncbi:hypothetical protein [Natrinema halophilum]|uniref:Uncharacterized protein n=1 Tax=Natrinema halophilum TaxID=1699371 RepID=A0A7D5GJV5_9EURY|nr:hypothetical protein [Natrinema halophilum]QLG50934.1 hypothetical protein HYG82_19900 [Natrinema halophilum]